MADQPSKESLERARAFFIGFCGNGADEEHRHGVDVLALEFDAVAKESAQNAKERFDLMMQSSVGTLMDNLKEAGQQNAALVRALRELEQKWRIEAQNIREQIVKGKSSGCIMMATVIEWKEEAAKFDAHADEIKKILASYPPAETKEKP